MSHRDEVLQAFGLSAADLEANRAGALSPRQSQQLLASGLRNLIGALFGVVVLALIMAFVVNRPLKPAQIITALVLGGALLAVGVYDLRRTRGALAEGVQQLSSTVRLESRGQQGWWLVTDQREFRLPVRPWKLEPGAAYHIYYSPRANRIVAMEPVHDGSG